MFFLYNAIISIVIVISLIAMAKSFIWFTRKLFDFVYCSTKLLKCISTALRTVKSVIVLRWRGRDKPTRSAEKNEQRCARGRHSHQYSKKPCKEKRDIVVSERSKYCGSIVAILWEIKSRSERVVSVCHREVGKVNRQGRKNGVRGTPFIMNSQQVRESISKNNIFHQQEKYAPFWKPNRSPVRRFSGVTPEQGDNVANQKRIDCLMETPPVNGRGRKNDNCGMIEKGSLSSNVRCVLSNAENGVNSGLEICKTLLDKMKTGRSYEPGKVVQRTSSTKYHVRLWSVDSHMSVKTATAVQSDNQGSSENTTKQNENDAICPNKNSKNDCKNKELDNQNDPKSKYFPCSVEALANMMLNVLMGGYWPLWDNASIEKKASSVEINPQGKYVHLRRSVKTLAKVMMHMVTFAVWPLWGSIKEDWGLFNDIYGETPPIACNTDHEIIARVKGQDMVNHDSYNNCLHCLTNREEGDRSESMEIIGTSKDHDEYTLNDNSPRSLETLKNKAQALHFHIKGLIVTLLSCITNVIATLKSKTTVVFCHIQLTSGTSPYSFFASTPKENKTAEGMVLSHAEFKKTDASQSCSWQPVPLSTQVVNSCAKKSSSQKYTSQTFCSRKGQNGQVNKSLMVGGTPSPVYFEKQTKGVVKETDAPPLSTTEVVKPPVWKADREKRRASFLSPDVKLVSHPKARAQNKESHSEGVSNLITSLNVRQGLEESIPHHSSENTMSTKVSDDIEKARSRETRRNEKQEQIESSEQKNATEVNWQENPPKRSPHERSTDQLVSISNSPTIEEVPKINIKRKNHENVDNKRNYELGIMDQASRLTRSRDKSNLEKLVESMEVEDYMQVSFTKQSEGLIDSGVPGMAAGLGSRYVRQALAPEQDKVMDTSEQVEKREEAEREREQKSQQRQSSWSFFSVSLPSFMKSPFTTQATLEEMEVVQEPPASLAQQADEEMALDEKPVLLKISCAQSEEMDIDSHYLTMSAPLVKPHGMDARCPKLTSALGAPAPESMKVAQQVFNPSRPVAHLLSVLTDTKRPFAPTSGMLEDAVVSLQMTSGEQPMVQGNTEQVISPDVASVEGPSFVQPLIKPTMPKLLPAQNMNGKTWQPVMHSVTHAVMQQSMQMGSNGDLLPAVPQIVAVPGSASQPHLLTCVLDPNDQIKMEQLELVPATADPSSDCVDVSDSDEDDDSDDEVELDLETIEKLSQLETSPDHAKVIIKLLAEKELQEAMQLRTESEPDSDSDCCDKSELTELLGSEAMGKLSELKACMNMYHEYSEKLAVLLAEEETSGQCNT